MLSITLYDFFLLKKKKEIECDILNKRMNYTDALFSSSKVKTDNTISIHTHTRTKANISLQEYLTNDVEERKKKKKKRKL